MGDLKTVKQGTAHLTAPTSFLGNYVAQHFGEQILFQLSLINPEIRKLNFDVASTGSSTPKPAAKVNKTQDPKAADATLPGAPLDERFTFDTFVVGKPNELAHAAARRVAEGGSHKNKKKRKKRRRGGKKKKKKKKKKK